MSTNEEIAKKTKLSIAKFVKKYGWEKFRDVEAEVIEKVSDFDECVFDTDEGIIMRNENIINLKRNALIVLLTADRKIITSRLKRVPALTKSNYTYKIKEILKEHEERHKKAADYAIDTSRLLPEEVCELIVHYFQMELNKIQ